MATALAVKTCGLCNFMQWPTVVTSTWELKIHPHNSCQNTCLNAISWTHWNGCLSRTTPKHVKPHTHTHTHTQPWKCSTVAHLQQMWWSKSLATDNSTYDAVHQGALLLKCLTLNLTPLKSQVGDAINPLVCYSLLWTQSVIRAAAWAALPLGGTYAEQTTILPNSLGR